MSNKLMTRKEFARRLEKMLTKYAGTECGHCPGAPFFKEDRKPQPGACLYCVEIGGVHPFYIDPNTGRFHMNMRAVLSSGRCPCHIKGPEDAVKAGWAWLEKEKAGE